MELREQCSVSIFVTSYELGTDLDPRHWPVPEAFAELASAS